MANKLIKSFQKAVEPCLSEAGADSPGQIPQPIVQPRSGDVDRPSPGTEHPGNTRPYELDRSLEPFEISRRSKPQHTAAVGAPITAQPYRLDKTIEQRLNKAMPPQTIPPTILAGTTFRSWPRKFFSLLNNLLETNGNRKYHCTTSFAGLHDPYIVWAVAPTKPPPNSYHSSPKDPLPGPPNPRISLNCPI